MGWREGKLRHLSVLRAGWCDDTVRYRCTLDKISMGSFLVGALRGATVDLLFLRGCDVIGNAIGPCIENKSYFRVCSAAYSQIHHIIALINFSKTKTVFCPKIKNIRLGMRANCCSCTVMIRWTRDVLVPQEKRGPLGTCCLCLWLHVHACTHISLCVQCPEIIASLLCWFG